MENLRIDSIARKEKIKLLVNGKEITAYKGETVLAALIAAGYKSLKQNPVSQVLYAEWEFVLNAQ